jgi:hypothetical protein
MDPEGKASGRSDPENTDTFLNVHEIHGTFGPVKSNLVAGVFESPDIPAVGKVILRAWRGNHVDAGAFGIPEIDRRIGTGIGVDYEVLQRWQNVCFEFLTGKNQAYRRRSQPQGGVPRACHGFCRQRTLACITEVLLLLGNRSPYSINSQFSSVALRDKDLVMSQPA